MDKNYRIKTNIANDTVVNVNVTQDIKTLEILSLNLTQENYYKLHESSYGVIVGRVLANDAFGIPNVKVSIFIKLKDEDLTNSDITTLYPYTNVQSYDRENRKYNLLPDENTDKCYKIVGTFPNKRLVLDNDTVLEVYDKYWKYTTVTNNAGDYMLFGIPTGNQDLHVDLDLSDIGILSQKPRDMLFKGYNIEQFDSPTQFKDGTNLSNLSQIISQNQSVYVYPFWGDESLGEIAISRCDIKIDYKFEPTCVFMGSLISDSGNEQISHKCVPSRFCGFNRGLIAGEGTIEMIRKTIDGKIEEFQLKGNHLIDENGVWCYQIPMNLDYVQTDEYGNIVPTDNPNKGIPTRTRVRFRVSFGEEDVEGSSKHRAKYLIPNNPDIDNTNIEPHMASAGTYYDKYYEFGSATMENCFRNLYWNKVYTVKSFIPRVQLSVRAGTRQYTGIRTTNISNNLNPFPFNKARFKLFFVYRVICIILSMLVYIYYFINKFIIGAIDWIATRCFFGICPFKKLCVGCMKFDAGLTDDSEDNVVYYPGCTSSGLKCTDIPSGAKPETKNDVLIDNIQQNLAQEFDTVNFDFYNDWVNGSLYFPVWYWRKTKKKKFLFGLFTVKAKSTYCRCDSSSKPYRRLKNGYLCALKKTFPKIEDIKKGSKEWYQKYTNKDGTDDGDKYWEKKYRNYRYIRYGLIKEITNKDGLNVYYYSYGNITEEKYLTDTTYNALYNRLFSTDLVLLGSFNDCDLDGVPKLFRDIPSTTANIPFISKLTEPVVSDDDSITDEEDSGGEEGTSKDTGTIVITGMDWLYSGDDIKNKANNNAKYGAGLLMDLGCTDVKTKPKSLVNLERMSELGVSLDMSYNLPYTDGNSTNMLSEYETHPDGLITRYEINDNNSRHMFASLNHLGIDSMAKNATTNYDVYKLGQMYPMDFDGMLTTSIPYTRTSLIKTYDNSDVNYVEFRLGEHPHAYLNDDSEKTTYYPLYNNSFYFYFGLNAGNTALDKFKRQYDAQCYQNKEYPFTWQITKQCGSWCQHPEGDLQKDYATIDVELGDIAVPYSFQLYDTNGYMLFSGDNVTTQAIYFGYNVDSQGELVKSGNSAYIFDYNNNNALEILKNPDDKNKKFYLTNQTYYLTVVDNKKRKQTTAIDVTPVRMSVQIDKQDLATKYYGYNSTDINEICNHNELYGTIEFSSFFIDANKYQITGVTIDKQPLTDKGIFGYNIHLKCPVKETHDGSVIHHAEEHVFLYFKVKGLQYDDLEMSQQDFVDKTQRYWDTNTQWQDTDTIITSVDENSKSNFMLYLDDNPWWNSHSDVSKRHNCGCQGKEDDYLETEEHKDGYKDGVQGNSNYKITSLFFTEENNGKLTFRVWIPSYYTCTLIEYCDYDEGKLSDNIVQQTLCIENGKLFGATLDQMPVNFMLSAETSDEKMFYTNNLIGKGPKTLLSWYELFKMDVREMGRERTEGTNGTFYWHSPRKDSLYSLPDFKQIDKLRIYEDYLPESIELDENSHITPNSALLINKYLFTWTFSLANATYSVDDDTSTHEFKVVGGKSPSLVRCFKPQYDKLENPDSSSNLYSDISVSHYLEDKWYVDSMESSTVNTSFPDIVQYPYKRLKEYPQYSSITANTIVFNSHVDTNAPESNFYLSSYFAGYSNYGGFIQDVNGKYVFNEDAKGIERIPVDTNVIQSLQPNVLDKEVHFSTYRGTDYQVLGGENYKSYFPAPFIDRRFDYDLYLFNMGDTIRFMKGNVNHGSPYQSIKFNYLTFVHGGIKNGIELTYDDTSYEIFNPIEGSDREDNSQNLEYAFTITLRTNYTYPHTSDTYKDKIYYFNKDSNVNKKHRFYKALCNGCRVEELYYSDVFRRDIEVESQEIIKINKEDEKTYSDVLVRNKAYHLLDKTIEKFGNLFYNRTTTNGRFDSNNFATNRTLNFVVPSYGSFNFSNTACTYNMEVLEELDTDFEKNNNSNIMPITHLSAKAQEGEVVEFTISNTNFLNIHINSLSDCVRLSTYNIMYMTYKSDKDSTNFDGKTKIDNLRLTYSIKEDDLCKDTHNTLTCPQTLILSNDGCVYEYLSHVHSSNSSNVEYYTFIETNVSQGYEFVTKDENANLVRLPDRISSTGKFDKRVLVNTSKANEALAYDDTDEAQECRFVVQNNNYYPINQSNASLYYQNSQCYRPQVGATNVYKYLGIGGIRRYVNNTLDNLDKSIHLINFNKVYAIHPFTVTYNHAPTTGTTDKVDVSLDLDLDATTTSESSTTTSSSSASTSATGRAETYAKTFITIDFANLISESQGSLKVEDLIHGVKSKIQDLSNMQVYESSDEIINNLDSTKVKLTLKYYGLRIKLTDENDESSYSSKYWWQEIYLKMYNGLIYCISYPRENPQNADGTFYEEPISESSDVSTDSDTKEITI